jgi:hypothetical protein
MVRAEIVRDANGVGTIVGYGPLVPRHFSEPIMNARERERLEELRDASLEGERVELDELERMAICGAAALMQSPRRPEMGFGLKSLVQVMALRARRDLNTVAMAALRLREKKVEETRRRIERQSSLLMPGKNRPEAERPESG